MKSTQELYNEHLERMTKAITLGTPDRTPLYIGGDIFLLKYAEPNAKASDFVTKLEWANDKCLEALIKLGKNEIDATGAPLKYPKTAGFGFLSPSKVPGRDLPDDMVWQSDEKGIMTESDYDFIIDKGWDAFMGECIQNRGIIAQEDLMEMLRLSPVYRKKYADAGVVPFTSAFANAPFETMCGARSMPKFLTDLYRMPDKVQAAMDAAMPEIINGFVAQIKMTNAKAAFLSGARASNDIISPKLFERFYFPYLKKLAEAAVEAGAFVYLHMDSRWDKTLDYFKEMPKSKCVFHPDGMTNIFKIKEVLDGHMCIMGDVHPSLLTLGTPDEVYKYCTKLIKEIGPSGFIMAVGCSTPSNAKPENMEALIASATGK